MAATYDTIIIGGGSSGCVTAGRLVGDHAARVLLLEAGPPDRHWLFKMPAGFVKFIEGGSYVTPHTSIPQPQLGGRRQIIMQGNVLGGGSSVNAMVYMRGRPSDYDGWDEAVGGVGWSYADLLPHFVRQEGNQRINNDAHGIDGPLKVSDPAYAAPASYIYIKTMQGLGLPLVDDFNAGVQEGVGFMQMTIGDRQRCSAVTAFLDPVRNDPNLTLQTNATVNRVLFDGTRANGVEYVRNGQVETAHADTVILAAGAFVTPKLLMLSGIGPSDHLREFGIETLVDLPGVGQNLHDHHEVPTIALSNGKYGYFGEDKGWNLIRNGLQYLLFRSGPVTTNAAESCAYVNPIDPDAPATIKLYCAPWVYLDSDLQTDATPADGVTLTACVIQPKSRGSVRLRSANPEDLPVIDPRYLAEPEDMALQVEAVRYAQKVLKARPMSDIIDREIVPGPDKTSDADLEDHCRRTVKTNWHPCGTCKMGRDTDPMAVLNPDLTVRGVDGLRVFDASMMPNVPRANTNAPTMAIADRAVDIMTGAVTLRDLPQSAISPK